MLFRRTKTWRTPEGKSSGFADTLTKQPHVLIAGATGSGKSVVINSMIHSVLFRAPCQAQLVLIDPKRVELYQYHALPHTLAYASEPRDIDHVLSYVIDLMESRYRAMRASGSRMFSGSDVYVFVDEFADLMTTNKRCSPMFCRIAQLGRAARIHLILATQRPTRDIITGQIKVNMDSRVALRCPSAQDSRNILGTSGAELLPRYGQCFYTSPDLLQPQLREVTMIPEAELNRLCAWWMKQK